jgi:hypothetical protein
VAVVWSMVLDHSGLRGVEARALRRAGSRVDFELSVPALLLGLTQRILDQGEGGLCSRNCEVPDFFQNHRARAAAERAGRSPPRVRGSRNPRIREFVKVVLAKCVECVRRGFAVHYWSVGSKAPRGREHGRSRVLRDAGRTAAASGQGVPPPRPCSSVPAPCSPPCPAVPGPSIPASVCGAAQMERPC